MEWRCGTRRWVEWLEPGRINARASGRLPRGNTGSSDTRWSNVPAVISCGRSARAIIPGLAFQGIIDGTTADVLDQAWNRRNAIVHGRPEAESPSRDEILRVVAACREVQAAMRLQAA